MVVCPFILPPRAAIRHWPAPRNDDATGVLLSATLWPSDSIFGRRPRCQCDPRFIYPEFPIPES